MEKDTENYDYFNIVGAGEIKISKYSNCSCGGIKGFSLDTKFAGDKFFCGGVIGKEEAKRMADFIYENLGLTPPSDKNKVK